MIRLSNSPSFVVILSVIARCVHASRSCVVTTALKCTVVELARGMGQTDRQTDGSQHCLMPPCRARGRIIIRSDVAGKFYVWLGSDGLQCAVQAAVSVNERLT